MSATIPGGFVIIGYGASKNHRDVGSKFKSYTSHQKGQNHDFMVFEWSLIT